MYRERVVSFAVLVLSLIFVLPSRAQPLDLILPTSNDALFYDDGPTFFQYTDRYFRGVRSRPWQGGQYGFVRNQVETESGVVYTRFHEGIDIKPLYRDRRGEPLDTVRAIDDGIVVYANRNPRASTYGMYVVVEHIWSGSPFYSLYAHLGDVHVYQGQRVLQGQRLGRIGYTGRGINRRRAHVHFEINMLLNREFEKWHDAYHRSENRHGIYNGLNLAGLDVAALYLALRDNPTLTIEEFISSQVAFFKVTLPNKHPLDLMYRYPWLCKSGYKRDAPSLEVSFTQSGLPVRIESTNRMVREPIVSNVERLNIRYQLISNHLLSGGYQDCTLSGNGGRYLELLTLPVQPTFREARLLDGPGIPMKVPAQPLRFETLEQRLKGQRIQIATTDHAEAGVMSDTQHW